MINATLTVLFFLLPFLNSASSLGAGQTISQTMRVTSYCPCEKCCGAFADGITASGHRIQPGDRFCAADRSIPFGTRMSIPGYSGGAPVPVLDRGGAIYENRIDVYFDTHQEALNWGVQFLSVRLSKTGKPMSLGDRPQQRAGRF